MNDTNIITINGKRFVAGLFWQPLTRARAYLQEAREIGKRQGMEVVAIRKGRVLQAGFARKTAEHAGAYSLAAALAGMLGEDWIGVFEVDAEADRYAIVGTKKGAIIPGCDVISTFDDVLSRLNADYNLHQFERVICPPAFGFEAEELQLADVLVAGKLRKDYRLASLGGGGRPSLGKAVVVFGALLVTGGAVVGGLAWRSTKLAEEEAAARALQQQQAAAAASAQAVDVAAAAAPLPHPWATQPAAGVFRQACTEAIGRVPLSMGGWVVESADCNGNALQLVFKRSGNATNGDMTRAAAASGYALGLIDDAGETAQLSLALAPLPAGGDDNLEPLATVSDAVKSLLQARMLPYTVAAKPAPPPPPVPAGTEPPPGPPPPDWKTNTISVSGPVSPDVVLAGIEALPGIRLNTVSVKRTESSLEWTMTGEINGK